MNWIKAHIFIDMLIMSLIGVLILTITNFIFVYYSPYIVSALSPHLARSISPCYRTLFHHDGEPLERVNFVFGDSFSEGAGDEFLDGDDEYGIFNKLRNAGSTELIFGRGGYGNIGTLVEFEMCYPLLSNYTALDTSLIQNYHVTFVFYEGNDLNNNLIEIDREINDVIYKARFFLPLYEFAYREIRRVISYIHRNMLTNEVSNSSQVITSLPVSSSGIELPVYPQSAATELTLFGLEKSLTVVSEILEKINNKLPEAENFLFLYLPAVASSYSFDNEIRVQSYSGDAFFATTEEFNLRRHQSILNSLRRGAADLGWFFCDTSPEILSHGDQGIAVHGPRDWKHFNKIGYGIVASVYEECLRDM